MKEFKLPSEKRKKFIMGKGFYAVLAVCMTVVCIAGYVAIQKSMYYTDTEPMDRSDASSVKQVGEPASDVVRSGDSSSSKQESSAQSSEEKVDVAEPTLLIWPVDNGTLQREYSANALVFSETMQDWRVHNGIDIEASVGTAVKAMANGTVKEIKKDEMLGNVVVIEHGSYTISYCNLQDGISVEKGDFVYIGDQIGGVSNTAILEIAQPSHLHLEVRKNGELIDPLTVINHKDVE